MSIQSQSVSSIQTARPSGVEFKTNTYTQTEKSIQKPYNKPDHVLPALRGGKIESIFVDMFGSADAIIKNTLNQASAKYPGAQADALMDFHSEITNMTQQELDEMKDALVKRMSSPQSSQWDRNLLQKMYQVTDAVAEHRDPGLKPGGFKPFPIKPTLPQFPMPCKPQFPHHEHKLPKNMIEAMFSETQKAV